MTKNKKGFSLIELTLSISIILILAIASFLTYNKINSINKADKLLASVAVLKETAEYIGSIKSNVSTTEINNYLVATKEKNTISSLKDDFVLFTGHGIIGIQLFPKIHTSLPKDACIRFYSKTQMIGLRIAPFHEKKKTMEQIVDICLSEIPPVINIYSTGFNKER